MPDISSRGKSIIKINRFIDVLHPSTTRLSSRVCLVLHAMQICPYAEATRWLLGGWLRGNVAGHPSSDPQHFVLFIAIINFQSRSHSLSAHSRPLPPVPCLFVLHRRWSNVGGSRHATISTATPASSSGPRTRAHAQTASPCFV